MSVINNNTMLLILSLFVIRFIQGKYTYIPDTNHVSRVYSVASILLFRFSIHAILYPMKSFVILYYDFTKYVRRAQYVCFL